MRKQNKNYTRLIIFVCTFFIINIANAVDLTDRISGVKEVGDWQVLEFVLGSQIGYRLSTTSILNPSVNIVFNFLPSNNCLSEPAEMIMEYDSYKNELDEGLVLVEYKFTKEKEQTTEAIKTTMAEGDRFAFFPFQKLTTEKFYRAGDKGKLAIWTPGGYYFKRSSNMYFSLDGFMRAYKEAKESCSDNMDR